MINWLKAFGFYFEKLKGSAIYVVTWSLITSRNTFSSCVTKQVIYVCFLCMACFKNNFRTLHRKECGFGPTTNLKTPWQWRKTQDKLISAALEVNVINVSLKFFRPPVKSGIEMRSTASDNIANLADLSFGQVYCDGLRIAPAVDVRPSVHQLVSSCPQ